jgi:hypothetical protein
VSERDVIITKLQLFKQLSIEQQLPGFRGLYEQQLNLVVKTDLGMSDGKIIAQACHAAMMSNYYPDEFPAIFGANAQQFNQIIHD